MRGEWRAAEDHGLAGRTRRRWERCHGRPPGSCCAEHHRRVGVGCRLGPRGRRRRRRVSTARTRLGCEDVATPRALNWRATRWDQPVIEHVRGRALLARDEHAQLPITALRRTRLTRQPAGGFRADCCPHRQHGRLRPRSKSGRATREPRQCEPQAMGRRLAPTPAPRPCTD